jgi:type VI secretion system protein ImpE
MDIKGISDLFREGDLEAALHHSKAFVRDFPDNDDARSLLMQLYLFSGEQEKALKQLDVMEHNCKEDLPSFMTLKVISEMIKADIKRRAFYQSPSEMPLMFEQDEPALASSFALFQAQREGTLDSDGVESLLANRPQIPFVALTDETTVEGELAEPDDLTAYAFEVFTAKQGYCWMAWHNIDSIEFMPYEKPIDLVYRRAVIKHAAQAEDAAPMHVFIPAIYARTPATDALAAMGRTTDWVTSADGLVSGIGQKCLLVGEELIPVLQLTSLKRIQPN